jgi:hypothetical protein
MGERDSQRLRTSDAEGGRAREKLTSDSESISETDSEKRSESCLLSGGRNEECRSSSSTSEHVNSYTEEFCEALDEKRRTTLLPGNEPFRRRREVSGLVRLLGHLVRAENIRNLAKRMARSAGVAIETLRKNRKLTPISTSPAFRLR